MALNPEWERRIITWKQKLPELFYRELGSFGFSCFTTTEHLSYKNAVNGKFVSVKPGEAWGDAWHYTWFKAEVVLPPEAEGKRITVKPDLGTGRKYHHLGGHAVVFVNGREAGGKDREHKFITLSMTGVPDEVYEVVLEAYGGKPVASDVGPGPVPYGKGNMPAPGEGRPVMGVSTFGVWEEEIYQLWLDVAWLWPIAETERKSARTFSNQLSLMEEYPEYRYLQSQPQLYRMIKTLYPALYERTKDAVKKDRFIPEGGMWVEADTNITGGESLIRQFIHGKRFFREEFGIESELLWLPDVFGYSGNMPQIMRGCGIKYFSTSKLNWNYNGCEPFPYDVFMWKGIDGSQVLTGLVKGYMSHTKPASLIENWNDRRQKEGYSTRLFMFGHGDGGGGATRDHLEYLRRTENLEGVPRTVPASPLDFFKDLEAQGIPENHYVGELYFPVHRGTYTSQAKTKKYNRESEFALREAEMWGVVAGALHSYEFPAHMMDKAWKQVLLNQFHDIIPGSSIPEVHKEAEHTYEDVLETAEKVKTEAVSRYTDASDAVTVFNSLSWERTMLVPLPAAYKGAENHAGEPVPVQKTGRGLIAEVTVPPCGYTTLYPGKAAKVKNVLHAEEHILENEFLKVELNRTGEIIGIKDKESGFELTAGACNSMKMYKDVPTKFDAWDLDSMYTECPVALTPDADIQVVETGPVRVKLRVIRKLNHSLMTQEISLKRDSRRVEFHTVIDWQERHKLLKVAFPVNIHANEAMYEIQFGHINRPTHFSRQFDSDRFEVCHQKWAALAEENRGAALLNDCKYGVNTYGNSINLTLLRAPMGPDENADRGRQEFTYALYAWNGSFSGCNVVREGYELNTPLTIAGGAAGEKSFFSLDAPNIVIDTVKPAEDGSGDIIVRLYESKRSASRCTLTASVPFSRVSRTDMLENPGKELQHTAETVALEFRAFEIKTVRLHR